MPEVLNEKSHDASIYKYHYFVSYSHSHGFGMCEIKLINKIERYSDVKLVRMIIVKDTNDNSIVVLNYQLMRIEDNTKKEASEDNSNKMKSNMSPIATAKK